MIQLVTGKTKLLGVIGDPVEHSFSPLMHNAAIAKLGLDYIYLPLPVKKKDLEKAIAGFTAIDLVGFNVTIPHKQSILSLLSESPNSEVESTAKDVGAVNTVKKTSTGWFGTNTDVAGFIYPLKNLGRDWQKVSPVIIGNGGAARAVVAGCAELGCSKIHICGRNEQNLQQFFESWSIPIQKKLKIHSLEQLPSLLPETELIVNATPVGMYPQVDQSPVEASWLQKLQPGAIAYDLIYTPNPTRFLQQARGKGAIAIDGLEMLIQQGSAALELWLEQPVPVEIMGKTLRQHLGLES